MGQPEGAPTPQDSNVPLIEGLGPEWNDIVGAIPEDQRATLAPKLKERISSYESLKPWQEIAQQGVDPVFARTALDVYRAIEHNPRDVYETIGQHLGITPAQAQQGVEQMQQEINDGDPEDPRIQELQAKVDTLSNIMLAQHQQETQAAAAAEADKKIAAEISAVQKKYGDIPEEQLLMRMMHMDMTAEQAAQDYVKFVESIQKRRPAPFVLGGAGTIPNRQIDPTKMTGPETRNVVAQMMAQAAAENKQ
jgi:hypothetical protein